VEEDLKGLGVGSHDDELGNAAVERLGGLVGTLQSRDCCVNNLHSLKKIQQHTFFSCL